MTSQILLETHDLSIGYTGKNQCKTIQKKLNIKLKSGHLISLLGINGIGKSTLLRTISATQKPLSGTILLEGASLADLTPEMLAQKISVVFTEKLPQSQLTVYEVVALGRIPYTNWYGQLTPADTSHIEEAIRVSELEPLKNRLANSLSDGQLQKVLIARAIAQDTPVIILDEPSTHLDLYHKIQLFRLLKRLCLEKNKCILFSTHDMDLALQMSDEIIALKGDFVIHGTTDTLIEQKVFDDFFNDSNIQFDPSERRFKINLL